MQLPKLPLAADDAVFSAVAQAIAESVISDAITNEVANIFVDADPTVVTNEAVAKIFALESLSRKIYQHSENKDLCKSILK